MIISTALELGSTLLALIKLTKQGKDSKAVEAAEAGVEVGKKVMTYAKPNSITAAMNKSIIRPMVGIENTLIHAEYATDLMTIIQLRDILAVLMHFSLQGSVGELNIKAMVDQINPSRSGLESLAGLENMLGTNLLEKVDGLEANISVDKVSSVLTEYMPIALGKVVNVNVASGKDTRTFPLAFREIPIPMSVADLTNTFEVAKVQDGFFMRIDSFNVGMITLPDLLNGNDKIKEKFKTRMNDLSGYYGESIKRKRNNLAQAIKTGTASLNTLANSFVISESTARKLEIVMGKKFDIPSQRNSIWEKVSANTIVIVNEGRGTFRFYTMGEDVVETYTRKELKVMSSKESSIGSLKDILELLNSGR